MNRMPSFGMEIPEEEDEEEEPNSSNEPEKAVKKKSFRQMKTRNAGPKHGMLTSKP